MSLTLRPATPADVPAILALIRELAEYEREPQAAVATEAMLHEALFGRGQGYGGDGRGRTCEAIMADWRDSGAAADRGGARVVGFALFFTNFSTWLGRAGIYLEDLYVRPDFRRRGLARKLLSTLAAECETNGYTRLSWAVLNWNVNAIALYDAVGGKPQSEWTTYRVSGPELAALAARRS